MDASRLQKGGRCRAIPRRPTSASTSTTRPDRSLRRPDASSGWSPLTARINAKRDGSISGNRADMPQATFNRSNLRTRSPWSASQRKTRSTSLRDTVVRSITSVFCPESRPWSIIVRVSWPRDWRGLKGPRCARLAWRGNERRDSANRTNTPTVDQSSSIRYCHTRDNPSADRRAYERVVGSTMLVAVSRLSKRKNKANPTATGFVEIGAK